LPRISSSKHHAQADLLTLFRSAAFERLGSADIVHAECVQRGRDIGCVRHEPVAQAVQPLVGLPTAFGVIAQGGGLDRLRMASHMRQGLLLGRLGRGCH
jgi:hypothetical protein